MTQNRKKLLDHFIGNAVTVIVHRILAVSAEEDYLKIKYGKEALNSLTKAQVYRKKINPPDDFSATEALDIKIQLIHRVNSELQRRIGEGYAGIDLSLAEPLVDAFLKEVNIA